MSESSIKIALFLSADSKSVSYVQSDFSTFVTFCAILDGMFSDSPGMSLTIASNSAEFFNIP